MAHARLDHEIRAEVAGDRPRFRGRLNDHEPALSVCFRGHQWSLSPPTASRHVSASGRGQRSAQERCDAFDTRSLPSQYVPSPVYTLVGALSWPLMHGVYRLQVTGLENIP